MSFSITAQNTAGNPVTEFNVPFTIVVTYEDEMWESAGVANETDLNIAFFDENAQGWVGLLPCTGCSHDISLNEITIALDHLTEFALLAKEMHKLYLPVILNGAGSNNPVTTGMVLRSKVPFALCAGNFGWNEPFASFQQFVCFFMTDRRQAMIAIHKLGR